MGKRGMEKATGLTYEERGERAKRRQALLNPDKLKGKLSSLLKSNPEFKRKLAVLLRDVREGRVRVEDLIKKLGVEESH